MYPTGFTWRSTAASCIAIKSLPLPIASSPLSVPRTLSFLSGSLRIPRPRVQSILAVPTPVVAVFVVVAWFLFANIPFAYRSRRLKEKDKLAPHFYAVIIIHYFFVRRFQPGPSVARLLVISGVFLPVPRSLVFRWKYCPIHISATAKIYIQTFGIWHWPANSVQGMSGFDGLA